MAWELGEWISVYRSTSGRRELALRLVAEAARARPWLELAGRCEAAVAHEQELARQTLRYQLGRAQGRDKVLAELDVRIDGTLGTLHRVLRELAGGVPGSEVGQASQALLDAVFPEGARAVTHLTYVDQAQQVGTMLKLLAAEPHAATVARLGLGELVEQLAGAHAAFDARLVAAKDGLPGYDVIRAMRAEGQQNLLAVIARILGRFPEATPEDAEARRTLLGPIREQNEAIRAYLRERRRVHDVDPETGEEAAPEPTADDPLPAASAPDASPATATA